MKAKTKAAEQVKRRRGRPPQIEGASYHSVYVYLRDDLGSYARRKAAEEHRSYSSSLAHLIEQGVALEVARRQEGSP